MNVTITPIRTKKDYDKALTQIGKLLEAKKGTPEFDSLEVLSVLVEDYERKHYPIPPPDPIEAIKFRMEQMGLTKKDLETCIGPRSRVSEVLNHKRSLSLAMIRKLRTKLDIPTEVLVGL
jgi:HTH-type transcriptional regulator/antitoxin HigA